MARNAGKGPYLLNILALQKGGLPQSPLEGPGGGLVMGIAAGHLARIAF